MLPFSNILVAIACAEADRELLAYAALLGQLNNRATFHLVHVLPNGAEASAADMSLAVSELRSALGPAASSTSSHVLRGDRLDTLLKYSAENRTDLILLGHRRMRSGRRSLARRLAMKAPCSVWLVPQGSAPEVRRVLAPVDFSLRSADALRVAAEVAAAVGLEECAVVHVRFNQAAVSFDEYEEIEINIEQDEFARFTAPLNLRGIRLKPLFEESPNIAAAILRTASEQQSDLIVIGTRGRSPAASVLLGSVTEEAIIETGIPLLAVKHHGAQMRLLQALLDPKFRGRGDLHYT